MRSVGKGELKDQIMKGVDPTPIPRDFQTPTYYKRAAWRARVIKIFVLYIC